MKASAEIIFKYKDSSIAELIGRLLEIDNRLAPKKMEISTTSRGNEVITKLSCNKLHTFFATIDDLLFSERLISRLVKSLQGAGD